ncbi:MAG: hypothetical protein R3A10_20785 [Caldilineaceae bacterium]
MTVLEAHVYPGGCAGILPPRLSLRRGRHLAGGFYPGGPHGSGGAARRHLPVAGRAV